MFGTAKDAVELFEEIQGVPMADSSYRDAIARYLYLGEREKALQTAERLATSRLWAVAGPTQVVGNIAAVGGCRADAGASHVLL